MEGMPIKSLLAGVKPIVTALKYAHLGLAVRNFQQSITYFSKIGFHESSTKISSTSVRVIRNMSGLELHLFLSDKDLFEPEKNILMDYNDRKYPGHTHACFNVPTVEGCREYLEREGLRISGERPPPEIRSKLGLPLMSIFSRDPDYTTFEFETTIGAPLKDVLEFTKDMIANPQNIDHVGIRVSQPNERMAWYAEKLGFDQLVRHYELKENPLDNPTPFIVRNSAGVDINFIPNATESPENILIDEKHEVFPGILYVAFTVDDAYKAGIALEANGVKIFSDLQVCDSDEACHSYLRLPKKSIYAYPEGKSIFLKDEDSNLIRLISADAHGN
jgi:catechol 2,3-dioxygenase-like lactoylglutathione lyase family enzyme